MPKTESKDAASLPWGGGGVEQGSKQLYPLHGYLHIQKMKVLNRFKELSSSGTSAGSHLLPSPKHTWLG